MFNNTRPVQIPVKEWEETKRSITRLEAQVKLIIWLLGLIAAFSFGILALAAKVALGGGL